MALRADLSGVPPVAYAVTQDRGRVGYQLLGEGPVDLLSMAEWAASRDATWEHPVHIRSQRYMAGLSRCAFFDPRGAGVSDPLPPERIGDLDLWVDDALAVMDATKMGRVVVWSEGFATHAAVALSIAHPERVEALVLANPYPSLVWADDRPYGYTMDAIDSIADVVNRTWGTGRVVYDDAPALGSDEHYLEFCARFERAAAGPATAACWVRASYRSDISALLPRIDCRTLVIHSGDLVHIPSEATRDVASRIRGARLIEASSPSLYWFDDPELSAEHREFIVGKDSRDFGTRQLATILFTDIVDSTTQAVELGDERWVEVLSAVDAFVGRTIERFGGRLVKQTGDGHLASFVVPTDALRAALAMRDGVGQLGVEMRTGVHTGEIELRPGGDLSGVGVHVAARVMAQADAGETLVTDAVPALVAGSGFRFAERGTHQLKGVPGEFHLRALLR